MTTQLQKAYLEVETGEIVVLSAADSELASLAGARGRLGPDYPELRLANLMQLGHNLSVDLYVEEIVAKARLVVVRLLGGVSYWPYGVEQVAAACPGDGEEDIIMWTPAGDAVCWGDNTYGQLGDGSTSLHSNPSHVFTSPGSHTVTLTVANPVNEPPSVSFLSPQDGAAFAGDVEVTR